LVRAAPPRARTLPRGAAGLRRVRASSPKESETETREIPARLRVAVQAIQLGVDSVDVIDIEVDGALHQAQRGIEGDDVDGPGQHPVAVVELHHHDGEPLAPHVEDLELESWLSGTGLPTRLDQPREGCGIRVEQERRTRALIAIGESSVRPAHNSSSGGDPNSLRKSTARRM